MAANTAQRAAVTGVSARYAEPATRTANIPRKPKKLKFRISHQPDECNQSKISQTHDRYNCRAAFAMLRGRNEHTTNWIITVITLYGIKNSDTVKKARKWLDLQSIEYQFHDFREDGLDPDAVKTWIDELGWQNLLNRRSTSWRSLGEQAQLNMDDDAALKAVLTQPTLIKRPLLDTGQQRYTGFSAASYAKIFNAHTL